MLCVSAPSTATLTSVWIAGRQGDIHVEAFAVRPNPFTRGQLGLGAESLGLAEYGSGFVPANRQVVTGVCPKDLSAPTMEEAARGSELGVEVRLRTGELGGGPDLGVSYTMDDGTERLLMIPFGIWLCASACPAHLGEPM